MSLEDIQAVQTRLHALKSYIYAIPKAFNPDNIRYLINEACYAFSDGTHYEHITENINKHLPTTIAAKLAELQEHCSNFAAPYSAHITSEAAAIITLLQQFQTYHLSNTPQLSTLGLLLQQLHSLQ
jgi:hypothetical protein